MESEKSDQSQKSWIDTLRKGGESAVVRLYQKYKRHFVNWAVGKYKINEQDALDIFQESVIRFYNNAVDGKISRTDISVKTYLFAIGKNQIFNQKRFESKFDDRFDEFDEIPLEPEMENNISTAAISFIASELEKLGEPCHTLLRLYYYQSYTLEAIARETRSKNTNVVKVQKSRCLKLLRNHFLSKYEKEDFYQ